MPLALVGPHIPAVRIDDPVSVVDIVPTLLDVLGFPAPSMAGISCWPRIVGSQELRPRDLLAEAVLYGSEQMPLIRWPWKLMLRPANGRTQLFHMVDDPAETRDLGRIEPQRRLQLKHALESICRSAARERVNQHAVELPADVRNRLRALGYVD